MKRPKADAKKQRLTPRQEEMIDYLSQYVGPGVRLLCRDCKWESDWISAWAAIPLVRAHAGHKSLQLVLGRDDTGLGIRRWTTDALLPMRDHRWR